MGANAKLNKHYNEAMLIWRRRYEMTKFTPEYMNKVLATAYKAFEDKELKQTVAS